jgi:hypothetical protein
MRMCLGIELSCIFISLSVGRLQFVFSMPYFSVIMKNNIPVAIQKKISNKTKPVATFLVPDWGMKLAMVSTRIVLLARQSM